MLEILFHYYGHCVLCISGCIVYENVGEVGRLHWKQEKYDLDLDLPFVFKELN